MRGRCLKGVAPPRRLAVTLIALFACAISYACVATSAARAHDIPADVKINAFFKPAGDRLELLVRLPLASLIDTDFPMRGAFLDLARADEPIRGGIKVWLTDNIDVYENGALLEKPRIVAALVSLALSLIFLVAGFWRPEMDTGGLLYQVVYFFSVPLHFSRDFTRGLIDSRHLVLYASVALFCLFMTVRSLESRRWR